MFQHDLRVSASVKADLKECEWDNHAALPEGHAKDDCVVCLVSAESRQRNLQLRGYAQVVAVYRALVKGPFKADKRAAKVAADLRNWVPEEFR